jgi:alkyldihydroxyacetonephosphate synthase
MGEVIYPEARLQAMVGSENVITDAYHRARVSYGGGMLDALRLRHKIVENIPDAVVYPRSRADVEAIVNFCYEQNLPIYIFGGGSSVTRGTEAVKGGITLDMSRHMNQVIAFNEVDQTITVQPGMLGPQLERLLNHAPEEFQAQRRYTCGHFPQSFEYSSVGGWVVTRGAGQNSTYYGKIEDIVIAQEYVTPRGVIATKPLPARRHRAGYRSNHDGQRGLFWRADFCDTARISLFARKPAPFCLPV